MQPGEVAGMQYFAPPHFPTYRGHFDTAPNNTPSFNLTRFFEEPSCFAPQVQAISAILHEQPSCFAPQEQAISAILHEPTVPGYCLGNNSTSDEAEEREQSLADERRKRRIISNRESARRSRMRKLQQLEELWSQVVYLRATNSRLINELNTVLEKHDQILNENVQLQEEADAIRKKLENLQMENRGFRQDNLTETGS